LEFGTCDLFGIWCLVLGILVLNEELKYTEIAFVWVIGIWNLGFIWNLVLGAWNFSPK
jgi:hypothetical protein